MSKQIVLLALTKPCISCNVCPLLNAVVLLSVKRCCAEMKCSCLCVTVFVKEKTGLMIGDYEVSYGTDSSSSDIDSEFESESESYSEHSTNRGRPN